VSSGAANTANGPADVFGAKEHDHDLKLFKEKKKELEAEKDSLKNDGGDTFSEETDDQFDNNKGN